MKKSIVALLLVAGLAVFGQPAFAVATTVDFAGALDGLVSYQPALFQAGSWASAVADGDDNNVPDAIELSLVSHVLADAALPQHAAAYTAFATNNAILAQVKTAMMANATFLAFLGANASAAADALNLLANGYFLTGDVEKINAAKDMWSTLQIPTAFQDQLTAALQSVPAVFGEAGNFDGDTYTNHVEALAATSAADYVARVYRNDPPPSLAVTITKNVPNTIASGSSVTLTAAAVDGTAPYSYVWKKNGTAIGGATAATYTFAAVAGNATFTCEVMDSVSPQAVASNAITIQVMDSAALPVMGVAGMALLVGLAGALGVRKIRK